ncbi:MAG: NAD(P)-dependent alcohol dehydrogenase [Phycisphaerae bacterium]|nr:NAD(P)-dependent alcohol dehydrogenase [Phycisphaerae bacterium]
MKAFVMKRIGEVGLMEKPIPEPAPDEALIRTTAALICTSDTHTVAGAVGERDNRTLGHEAVGVVEKTGEMVRSFKKGDRVAVNAITPCFTCENCLRGYTSQCTQMLGGWKFANVKDGSLAEYFLVNNAEANLALIGDDLSDEQAVYCCDVISTGLMGAEHANIPVGGSVAVFAQGPVGLMATAGARLRGAGLIIAVESVPKRQELARKYGADIIVDFSQTDPVQEIRRLCPNDGVDAGVDSAIEALGSQETFEACIRVTRAAGTISSTGYYGKGDYLKIPRIDWGVGMSDKTIRTGLCPGGKERMARLFRLIRNKRIEPTAMTTHRFPFTQIEQAFKMMQNKEDNIIKPLITFAV